jgi:RNA recognition motif-containing protein
MKLFVASLARDTTEQDLREFFEGYKPGDIRIILDRETGQSRGFGFIEFFDPSDAQRALFELDGAVLNGRPIVVKQALPQDRHGARP